MSGCARAIAERDRLRSLCAPLAYGLHLRQGFKCRRAGGRDQCGACAGDLLPSDMPSNEQGASLSDGNGAMATTYPKHHQNAPAASADGPLGIDR